MLVLLYAECCFFIRPVNTLVFLLPLLQDFAAKPRSLLLVAGDDGHLLL
ncbi:MAG: cell division inhibitor SulA, partial [Bacillariaceae sp.]